MSRNPQPGETWNKRGGEGPVTSREATKEHGRGSMVRATTQGHDYPNTTAWKAEENLRGLTSKISQSELEQTKRKLREKYGFSEEQVDKYVQITGETAIFLLQQLEKGRLNKPDAIRTISGGGSRGR